MAYMTGHQTKDIRATHEPSMAQLPLGSILLLLHNLDTESKLWLIDQLSEDVHDERKITQSAHYKAAMADVEAGRVTEWNSVDEMFEKLERMPTCSDKRKHLEKKHTLWYSL